MAQRRHLNAGVVWGEAHGRWTHPPPANLPKGTQLSVVSGNPAKPGLDKAAGKLLKAGGFVFLPQDMPHALWTAKEPVELQVNGTGPFGVNYVNPTDDPSRSQN